MIVSATRLASGQPVVSQATCPTVGGSALPPLVEHGPSSVRSPAADVGQPDTALEPTGVSDQAARRRNGRDLS